MKNNKAPMKPLLIFFLTISGFISIADSSVPSKENANISSPKKEVQYTRFNADVHQYIQKYCIDCHGADKQKADRRFDGRRFKRAKQTNL